MASNESKIPVGTILVGKYRVVREIGRGGMAAVYESEQLSLGKKVAVKVLASELAASTIVIERFFREARAAASVKSPYIVDVYDSGRLDDGRPFIAMEMLEGESLYDRMARVRIIDVETTLRVIMHTAKGLVKAHNAGIVHRDLKPENIFLTKGEDGDDLCKILDFGLAKFYAPVNPEDKAQKRLTREGAVFGTPAYMSPEQVKGQGNVDHRADLWALGCMAYECLIGRPVWNMDQGVAMTFAAIATSPIPVPSDARPDLPPEFDAWFKRCLERNPDKRYQTAKELSDAFVEAWGHRPHTSSASFPHVRPVKPMQFGDVQELSSEVLDAVRPPSPPSSQRVPASGHSDPSLPLVQRASVDVPPTSEPTPMPQSARPVSPFRMVLSAVFFAGAVSAAIVVWMRFLNPQVFAPIVRSTATAPASAAPSDQTPTGTPSVEPKWAPIIAEAQRLFTAGSPAEAQKKLKEAIDQGGIAARVATVYAEQYKFAVEKGGGPCKATAFSRPRLITEKRAERPSIAATSKGAVVTWADDHEADKKNHVYGVAIDPTGRMIRDATDLTPEAAQAERPQLATVGTDRLVLLYWDERGKEAGVRGRLLDAEGRIDRDKGASVRIGGARSGQFWPSIDKAPEGFWVVWQDDRDKEGDYDLFARHLSNDLDTVGPETRLTDYTSPPKSKTPTAKARLPSVAVAANTLLVAYRLDRDKDHAIMRLRIPLSDMDKGLEESKDPNRADRVLGDVQLLSEDKTGGDAPAIECGSEGCFIVWHGEAGGANIAMIDPKEGRVVWRKRLDKGARPALGVFNGQVSLTYYEKNAIKMATLTRDPITSASTSTIFRIFEPTYPRAAIAGAGPKEWYIAWLDSDLPKGAAEVYAARVVCR